MTNQDELIKVFFYGTLKKGQPNESYLKRANIQFLSEVTTVDKWPLVIATEANAPFLLNKKGVGKNVQGEVYLVDKEGKRLLDWYESVEDKLYSLIQIDVRDNKTNEVSTVYAYVIDNFKKNLINDKTIFFQNYTSVNEHFGEFKRFKPEQYRELYKQIKN